MSETRSLSGFDDGDIGGRDPIDRAGTWAATCRLGVMVSTVAGLLAATFADRVTHSTLIVAVIAGASLVGWFASDMGDDATQ